MNGEADLVFDIDYILESVCKPDRCCQFRVAPTTLIFHHVKDLHVAIDWGKSGFQTAIHGISIAQITRSQVENQKICLDRPYYDWKVETNFPKEGRIAFGASGFIEVLRAAPVLIEEQKLPPSQHTPFFPPCA